METIDRVVRIELDIVECIFTINGLSIQRVDVLENIKKLEKQLLRQKRRLTRKEQNSNNSKKLLEKIDKIENRLDNVYNEYMNKCISVVIKSNPTSVIIIENDQRFLQKYYEFVIRMKVRCKMHGIEFKVVKTYA
ncbi:hypothetical protein [uncultured Catenibacterium sp.]|uniref:hypothetical protein n=1 Tax=uncultured Catenibacterium sp. TaxID=286142 RepID=UPI0025DC2772|nr:hypothetical protein [uncultured Catenibacterium sp.]